MGLIAWKSEWKPMIGIMGALLLAYHLPLGNQRFEAALFEGLYLLKWYVQEHVVLCLFPAFYIAGGVATFLSKDSIIRYLGPSANKWLAYGVSSVSGGILSVCSCTVLPLFSGIYRMGAGIGPATVFLYSGPAVNVLAIILTANVLGLELGIARAIGAILFGLIIGLLMHLFFGRENAVKEDSMQGVEAADKQSVPWLTVVHFGLMVSLLIFANWSPSESIGFWQVVFEGKWFITAGLAVLLVVVLCAWYGFKWWKGGIWCGAMAAIGLVVTNDPFLLFLAGVLIFSILLSTESGETGEWFEQTWDFTKQIVPLLIYGVLIAGFLLGRPGSEGLIPSEWVNNAVGGNSLSSTLFASVVGAFMYFATLTEIPILQGLIGAGMGKGPALALLLAGPALSLPNMLVIKSVIGFKKTFVFVSLVIVMSTICGMVYGNLF